MSFTPEQEAYLTDLADKGLAEQAEIVARNKQVLVDVVVKEAREAKKVDLEAQAQALIDEGLLDFDTKVAPTITVDAK